VKIKGCYTSEDGMCPLYYCMTASSKHGCTHPDRDGTDYRSIKELFEECPLKKEKLELELEKTTDLY